jgi:hypothetical protein
MPNTRRQEYNKAHYEAIRIRREALEEFRKQNPERYAELMKKVQEGIKEEREHPWIGLSSSTTPQNQATEAEIEQNSIRIHEFLVKFANGRKDYFIDVEIPHDGWVETHKYFDSLYSNSFEEAKEVVLKYHPKMQPFRDTLKVTHVEKCGCPLCT